MIPYYQDNAVTIYHGDCLEILPALTEIDLIFTSPPYNLRSHPSGVGSGMHTGSGYNAGGRTWRNMAALAAGYGTHDDAMPQAEYDTWQRACIAAMWKTLSANGAIFYNHKPRPFNGELKLPLDYGPGLPLRQIIVWDRGTGMNFAETHFVPKSEWLLIWARPGWRLRDRSASQAGDVWRIRPEDDNAHPAAFPLALPSKAISATSAKIVLDPFMGSGTTLRAAKNHGRQAIGIDVEERFCQLAAERCAQEVLALA